MSTTLRYPFSVPVHISLYFHVLFMLLSESDVHSVLISKRFLSGFSSLRNYKLKSVKRTLHIVQNVQQTSTVAKNYNIQQ